MEGKMLAVAEEEEEEEEAGRHGGTGRGFI